MSLEHLNGCLPLTIGGKPRKLYFDYTFVSIMHGVVPEAEFGDVSPLRLPSLVVYAALMAGEDENELPENFSERIASRWLMGLTQAEVAKIIPAYEQSMGFIMEAYGQGTMAKLIVANANPQPVKAKKEPIKASL